MEDPRKLALYDLLEQKRRQQQGLADQYDEASSRAADVQRLGGLAGALSSAASGMGQLGGKQAQSNIIPQMTSSLDQASKYDLQNIGMQQKALDQDMGDTVRMVSSFSKQESKPAPWKTIDSAQVPQGKALQQDATGQYRVVDLPTGVKSFQKSGQDKKDTESFRNESSLRKEFSSLPEVKNFKTVEDNYKVINTIQPTAAGDLSMIFSYMKMLDPASTVREGEFANAQNAAGVPDQVKNMWNRLNTGERLNESQRQDFKTQAHTLYNQRRQIYDEAAQNYGNLSQQYGLKSEKVVLPRSVISAPSDQKNNRVISKKQYSPSADKTRIIYSDGSIEVLDGRQ